MSRQAIGKKNKLQISLLTGIQKIGLVARYQLTSWTPSKFFTESPKLFRNPLPFLSFSCSSFRISPSIGLGGSINFRCCGSWMWSAALELFFLPRIPKSSPQLFLLVLSSELLIVFVPSPPSVPFVMPNFRPTPVNDERRFPNRLSSFSTSSLGLIL